VIVRSRGGFSLVEMLLSLTVLGIVLTSVFSVTVQTQRDYTRQRENIRSQDNLRMADAFIRTVLRSGLADPRLTRQTMLDPDPRNTNRWDNIRVKADFNPADGDFQDPLEDVQLHVVADSLMVRLQAGGAFSVYAYPVRTLHFEYYRANNNLITTEADVAFARRIKYTVSSPNPAAQDIVRRTTWVYLRNRR
jgi:prepilin-type N-terminal cleavage/methylation domain-containing protein